METSEEIINKAIEKFNNLEDKELDWRSFYTGYLEAQAEQLALLRVSGSLLEITLEEWEHTCGDGCCYFYGEDIYLNGEKLDEQNAEDSKNALTAVLTKLGYNVEINYR